MKVKHDRNPRSRFASSRSRRERLKTQMPGDKFPEVSEKMKLDSE